ncbi:MMPL family transporter [Bacillus salitolerans]|uniref:MMPL family transporter n=1 Tax=Bacillus salitolerans TaxID=1437434 RepID=A0ABW4LSG3_9BACI
MKTIIRGKWFVLVAWITIVAALFMLAPNMADLVRDKGQITVPNGYSSSLAEEIMDDVQSDNGKGNTSQVALVFHTENEMTSSELSEVERAIRLLEENSEELGITEILSHFNEEVLKEQLVSDDGSTILTAVTVSRNDREAKEISNALYEVLEEINIEHYYTSGWMIDQDLITSSEEGLKKTEGITVVFILLVLVLVFRSAIAPLIPLITVGITYLASQSIVAILVDNLNFPLSNFTQIFLVCVLFGIGTDYCILLLSRFKEEMSHRDNLVDAIVETYRNAGRTVFFSGLAVMIGFAAIGFSQFKLYQSAAAVAVGVAVLLLALFTVVPFFMAVLGPKLFWPAKGSLEHKDSTLWGVVGRFTLARPLIALVIVAGISVPFLVTYDGELSFNSLEEIGDDANSIKAFNLIADGFGPGESMPTQVVIKNDEKMDAAEYIALAEEISKELEKVDLVDSVRSVTRPTGEKVDDFFVTSQAEQLEEGLGEGNKGIKQISEGLEAAGSELSKSEPELIEASKGISELITGTDQLENGLVQLQGGLKQIEDGIRKGSQGSSQVIAGLEEIKMNAEKLVAGSKELVKGYELTGSSLGELEKNYKQLGQGLNGLSMGLSSLTQSFENLEKNYDGISSDVDYMTIKGTVSEVQKQAGELAKGLNELNTGLSQISGGISTANDTFKIVTTGYEALIGGMTELINGIEQQQAGLEALANGQGEIIRQLPGVTNGLSSINEGQQQLLAGFGDLGGQISQLTDGLDQSANGLNEVYEGLSSAQQYLSNLASSTSVGSVYIPEDVLKSEDFEQALDAYMSKDRKVMTMDVIFEANPYSNEAMDKVEDIKAAVERATKDTKLENAEVAIGGITSINADLSAMSNADYSRTVVLMLLGISLILVFLFRSLIMPIYLIGSLILTYYTSMAIAETIFVNILGYSGISWSVPFFAFVILVALGVDYSIFLMDRFNEYKEMSVEEAMLISMRKMGTVIISAAIILGGTFAAMMPSGMQSLLQIATIVLTGLFLYALVVLPLFVPVMVKTFGKANWWPFTRA